MKNRRFPLLPLFLLTALFFSCKKDDIPKNNEIDDAAGISAHLKWALDDSSLASAADLDLVLYQGTGNNKSSSALMFSSENNTDSEFLNLPDTIPEGDYTLVVDFFQVPKNGAFSLVFTGNATGKMYEINHIQFSTNMTGTSKDAVIISRRKNKFTVTRL
jgi:hypothetical protein